MLRGEGFLSKESNQKLSSPRSWRWWGKIACCDTALRSYDNLSYKSYIFLKQWIQPKINLGVLVQDLDTLWLFYLKRYLWQKKRVSPKTQVFSPGFTWKLLHPQKSNLHPNKCMLCKKRWRLHPPKNSQIKLSKNEGGWFRWCSSSKGWIFFRVPWKNFWGSCPSWLRAPVGPPKLGGPGGAGDERRGYVFVDCLYLRYIHIYIYQIPFGGCILFVSFYRFTPFSQERYQNRHYNKKDSSSLIMSHHVSRKSCLYLNSPFFNDLF